MPRKSEKSVHATSGKSKPRSTLSRAKVDPTKGSTKTRGSVSGPSSSNCETKLTPKTTKAVSRKNCASKVKSKSDSELTHKKGPARSESKTIQRACRTLPIQIARPLKQLSPKGFCRARGGPKALCNPFIICPPHTFPN